MSIYTTTDRDNVKSAIIDLAAGKRVVSTEVGGQTRQFHQSNLNTLRALLADIIADLEDDSEMSGSRRVRTIPVGDSW